MGQLSLQIRPDFSGIILAAVPLNPRRFIGYSRFPNFQWALEPLSGQDQPDCHAK